MYRTQGRGCLALQGEAHICTCCIRVMVGTCRSVMLRAVSVMIDAGGDGKDEGRARSMRKKHRDGHAGV